MAKENFIKKLSYNSFFVKTARFLHLRGILRKGYYLLFKPKNNILEVDLSNIKTRFYVKNPDEFRLIESVTGDEGEKGVLESLISLLKSGDVVYDVGANVGVYSIILSKVVGNNGKVIAFEPEKESLIRLEQNIKLNSLANIIVIDKALGEKDESANLYISGTTGNFSLVNIYDKEAKSESVEIVNGDSFVNQQKLLIPKAVKIDVEGYEYSVLFGLKNTLSLPDCKIICCEVHVGLFPEGISEEKIIEFIKSLGFKKIEIFKREFSAYHIIAQKI
jgi:FkbM family methyltransferase